MNTINDYLDSIDLLLTEAENSDNIKPFKSRQRQAVQAYKNTVDPRKNEGQINTHQDAANDNDTAIKIKNLEDRRSGYIRSLAEYEIRKKSLENQLNEGDKLSKEKIIRINGIINLLKSEMKEIKDKIKSLNEEISKLK